MLLAGLLAGSLVTSPEPVERPHQVAITLGGGTKNQRDENFNRSRYQGGLGCVRLQYLYAGDRVTHQVTLGGAAGLGTNRFSKEVLWVAGAVDYAADVEVMGPTTARPGLSVGGRLGGGPSLYQFVDEDADHVNWVTLYALSPTVRVSWPITSRRGRHHQLSLATELPLIGLLSRPPRDVTFNNDKPEFAYLLRRTHRRPRLSSWHNTQGVALSATWSMTLSPLVDQGLSWASSYLRVSVPETFASWTHLLSYRIAFKIPRRGKRRS